MPMLSIPAPLLDFTDNIKALQFHSVSTNEFIKELKEKYPELFRVLFTQNNMLNGFVNIYLNQKIITDRFVNDTPLLEHDHLEIMIAVAGG